MHCCHCLSDLTKLNLGRPCSSALALYDDNTPKIFKNNAAIKKKNNSLFSY